MPVLEGLTNSAGTHAVSHRFLHLFRHFRRSLSYLWAVTAVMMAWCKSLMSVAFTLVVDVCTAQVHFY